MGGLGLGLLACVALGRAPDAPPGWTADAGDRPAGAMADASDPPDPRRWRVEPLSELIGPRGLRQLQTTVALDPGDRLEVYLDQVTLELMPGVPPVVQGARCGNSATELGGQVALDLRYDGEQLHIGLDDAEILCRGRPGEVRLVAGPRRVHLADLVVEGQPVPSPLPAPVGAAVLVAATGLGAVAGALLGPWSLLVMLPGLVFGLLGVRADPADFAAALRVPTLAQGGAGPWAGVLLAGFSVAAFASARLVKAAAVTRAGPWMAAGLLLAASWGPLAVLRVRHGGWQSLGSLVGISLVGLLVHGLVIAAARLLHRQSPASAARSAVGVGLAGAAAVAVAAAGGMTPPIGGLALGIAGAALGVILWANRNAVRGFNLLSLSLSLVLLVSVEQGLRHTRAAASWRAATGWAERTVDLSGRAPGQDEDPFDGVADDFAMFDQARHTAYPARGYPVAYGPKQAPLRIVAFGGSSTGGAWQMQDLRLFFPARLDQLLGDRVEVVNQGVGGWTTFHIARYASTHMADLDPDLVLLYVGNNDCGPGYPATLAQLYAAWERRGDAGPVQRWLRGQALYQWLTQLVGGGAGLGSERAVSLDELRDNLQTVLDAARAQGAPVLLVGEANVELLGPLESYHAVMREFAAEQSDVTWLDGAQILAGRSSDFLDSVHLSEEGHQRLATALAEAIRDQDLLPVDPAAP